MPKTLVNCPNCKQPIQADLQQLFDVGQDPSAKQTLLSGTFNIVQCPHCGYQGNIATPIVYHDPQKELLITFIPPEVALPKNEQERIIGSLINQVMSKLPQEQRKAYLLQPQGALTLQGLVEHILEADGITKDMIQANQQRMNLIQRLVNSADDVRAEILREEDKKIDSEFFSLLDRLIQSSAITKDQETGQRLIDLQKYLLSETSFGKELSGQLKEVEAAVQSLREAGNELTREKLLDLVIKAPNDTRLQAYVSLARPGMDYVFFQQLSEKIERARADGRTRLVELRQKLLDLIDEVDKRVSAQVNQSRELLNTILGSDNIEEVVMKNLPAIDEFFLQELNRALDEAKKEGNQDKLVKLEQVASTVSQASQATQALEFIEALLEAPDEASRRQLLEDNQEQITPDFLNTLSSILYQVQSGEDLELSARFKELHRQVLRFSMEANLNAG